MSGTISTYLSQKWLKEIQENAIPTYAGLHYSSPPSEDPTSTELDGGSYHRNIMAWSLNNTTISISSTLLWTGLNATSITHIGIYDSQYKGNLLAKIALSPAVVVPSNGVYEVSPGEIYLSLS